MEEKRLEENIVLRIYIANYVKIRENMLFNERSVSPDNSGKNTKRRFGFIRCKNAFDELGAKKPTKICR